MKTVRFLFNDDMARAVVEGRKTVTRRPVQWGRIPHGFIQAIHDGTSDGAPWPWLEDHAGDCRPVNGPCAPGDLLIGRECWSWSGDKNIDLMRRVALGEVWYRATPLSDHPAIRWRPSIHMPDWAARIRRRVVSVTVERVQDIGEADAAQEGFGTSKEMEEFFRNCAPAGSRMARPRDNFESAWDSIYAAKGLAWNVNPWVWRIEFSAENVK